MSLIADHRKTATHRGATIQLPLFLDHQSTTPLAPEVREVMMSAMDIPGNAASRTHIFGLKAHDRIEAARAKVAALISAHPDEIIFTSGATEANNLALLGFARQFVEKGHIISVNTEHSSVLSPLVQLQQEGFTVTSLPVGSDGRLDLTVLENALQADTRLVSIHAANNEIGTLQDLRQIGALCKSQGIAFHTDAVQALSTEKIDVSEMAITMLSLSAHKLYGPQGIGALYVRRGAHLTPLLFGGDQQLNMRAGTLPTMLILGLGEACHIAQNKYHHDHIHLSNLAGVIKKRLTEDLGKNVQFNGDQKNKIPGCLSISFRDVDAEEMLFEMPELGLSTGSACASASSMPSHVLLALGLSATTASSTLRLGIGRYVTEIEADYASKIISNTYTRLKAQHDPE